MDEPRHILETLDRLPTGEQAVLATVVDVVGSGYRRPGARMLLTRSGTRSGGISGGCLEGDLARRCWDLTTKGPVCVDYDTRGDIDQPAGPYDTGCEGLVRVLVERIPEWLPRWHPLETMRDMLLADASGDASARRSGVAGRICGPARTDAAGRSAHGAATSTGASAGGGAA